jgi:hypothetical protein
MGIRGGGVRGGGVCMDLLVGHWRKWRQVYVIFFCVRFVVLYGVLGEIGVSLWCFDGGGVVDRVVKMVRRTSLLGARSSAMVCGFIFGAFCFGG